MKNMTNIYFYFSIGFIVFMIWILFIVNKKRKINEVKESLNQQLLLVSLPRDIKTKEGTGVKEIIAVSEQILSNLAQYKKPISLEIVNPINDNVISFYLSVPKQDTSLFIKTITAFMPFAQVTPVKDYSLFTKNSQVQGADIVLKENYALKTRDYDEFSEDPLKSILNSFTKVNKDEGVCLQIVLKPSSRREDLREKLQLYKETKNDSLLLNTKAGPLKEMSLAFSSSFKKEAEENKETEKEINQDFVESMTKKLSKKLFDCSIRVVVSTNDKTTSKMILSDIENNFSDLDNPILNSFKFLRNNSKKFIFNYCYKLFTPNTKITLTTSEICSF
ncbi:MAG: hypothetical protein PHO23_01135 [Candidatus Pacebacteria bacterium]|nr:hypothetical protein [Candidatus Paceibacterota bacterium]